jgi:hypothetical protein
MAEWAAAAFPGNMEMTRLKNLIVILLSMGLIIALIGCGSPSENGSDPASENNAENRPGINTEIHWLDYTMKISSVEDEVDQAGSYTTKGRLVRVIFDYVSDSADYGGFYYGEGDNMLDWIQGSVSLVDAADNSYDNTGSIGHISFKDPQDITAGLVEVQSVFSLTFDVPVDAAAEDLSLSVEGQTLPLSAFL